MENRAHGIHVCALCPGFTRSEFHDVSQARKLVSKLPGWLWSEADEVVRQGLDAVERGRVVCVPGRANRIIKTLVDVLPRSEEHTSELQSRRDLVCRLL